MTEPIKCALCSYRGHTLAKHVWEVHNVNPVDYTAEHGALLSPFGVQKMKEIKMKEPMPTKTVKMSDLFPHWKQTFADDNTYEVGVFENHPLIPVLNENYSFPEDTALELLTVLEKPVRNNVWIHGPTQAGKTTLVRNLAAVVQRPLFEINGNVHLLPSSFFGKPRARAGETYFQHGIVVKWLRHGGWLLINEYDTLDTECVNALKSVLEFPRRLTLVEHDDELIEGHPDCRLIVACNTQGRGDDTGMFINTQVQSIADMARFNAFLEVDYIAEDQEKAMLATMFPDVPAKAIENIVKVANATRAQFKRGQLTRVISTAEAINWCENYQLFYTGHHAARISFLNGYDDTARTAVRELINNAFGQEDSEVLNDARAAARASDKATDEG